MDSVFLVFPRRLVTLLMVVGSAHFAVAETRTSLVHGLEIEGDEQSGIYDVGE
ncbi:MAG: hypothetical protein KDA44_05165 [Planctomycetales bacterium]|nr:hypothetical protein [Planctomycetales bacterium]